MSTAIAANLKHFPISAYKVDVPEGRSGEWSVERFEVDAEAESFQRLRAAINFREGGRFVPQGTYTRLCCGSGVVMSDTPDEIRDHSEPMRRAIGHCLVNGLGLGMVANGMLLNGAEQVTCIEISADVISLVAPHWQSRWGSRFEVIHANAYEYKPPRGVRYGMVWHDIWDSICSENLAGMAKLARKYARRCDSQGAWAKLLCLRARRFDY